MRNRCFGDGFALPALHVFDATFFGSSLVAVYGGLPQKRRLLDLVLGLLCLVELSVDVALGIFFDRVKQCVFGSFLLSGGLL